MAQGITSIYPFYTNEIDQRPDGKISEGFFFTSETDKVRAVSAVVQMRTQIPESFVPVVGFVQPNTQLLSGHQEILAEFAEGHVSDRANDVIAKFRTRMDGTTNLPEIWAAKIKTYVEAVRDWSGDVGIGGDIATVILERGQKWRWFHRPSFCPEA
jgi:hypothetical protein